MISLVSFQAVRLPQLFTTLQVLYTFQSCKIAYSNGIMPHSKAKEMKIKIFKKGRIFYDDDLVLCRDLVQRVAPIIQLKSLSQLKEGAGHSAPFFKSFTVKFVWQMASRGKKRCRGKKTFALTPTCHTPIKSRRVFQMSSIGSQLPSLLLLCAPSDYQQHQRKPKLRKNCALIRPQV